MDEGAAGRQAAVDQIRAQQQHGRTSTIGTSPMGDTADASVSQKALLGA